MKIKILVDTNVVINYISGREDPYSEESDIIMTMCAEEELEGYIAFHSLSTIWYWARKYTDFSRRNFMRRVCKILRITATDSKSVINAVDNVDFKDFEDNLQECCAVTAGVDYIVTGNVKDYEHSRVKAVTPTEFISIINQNS